MRKVICERIEQFELKSGVQLNANAFQEDWYLKVIVEILGDNLKTDLEINCCIYNPQNEICELETYEIDKTEFEGIDQYQFEFDMEEINLEQIGRVVVFPKRT